MILLRDFGWLVVSVFFGFFPYLLPKRLEDSDVVPRITAVYPWEAGAGTKAIL